MSGIGAADRRLPRRIAHFDLDQFFVAVERVRDPSLKGLPVLVGQIGPRGVVATASYEAREFGAHSAMPMAEAKRLCPQAIVVAPNRKAYQRASAIFHEILADFAPVVQEGGLDEAYADLTGIEAGRPTGPRQAAEAIRAEVFTRLAVRVSVCIAGGRSTAKVGSDSVKPDGLLEIPPGGDAQFLAPLPIRRLPSVGAHWARELKAINVITIGDIAKLDKSWMARQFGRRGAELVDRAQGIDPTPVLSGGQPARGVSRETTFPVDITSIAHLQRVLRELSESVAADLREQNRRARTVTLKLRWSDFSTISRSQTFERPVFDSASIGAAAATLLRRTLAGAGQRPVRLIGVGVTNLEAQQRQLPLGDQILGDEQDAARRRDEQRDAAIDAVRRRFGPDAVRRGL